MVPRLPPRAATLAAPLVEDGVEEDGVEEEDAEEDPQPAATSAAGIRSVGRSRGNGIVFLDAVSPAILPDSLGFAR